MNIFWSRVRLEVEYFLYHETRRLIISLLHCNLVSLSFISFWQKVISHFMKKCISHSVKLISHAISLQMQIQCGPEVAKQTTFEASSEIFVTFSFKIYIF